MMLQRDKPDDFVIATGRTTTLRDKSALASRHVGLAMEDHLVIDEKLYRPAEVEVLLDNLAKAEAAFGWKAEISFEAMIQEMVEADLKRLGGRA